MCLRRPRRIGSILLIALLLSLCVGGTIVRADSTGKSYYTQGQSEYNAKHYQQAANDFVQAINHGYRTAGAYYQLGLSYSRLKQWNNAVWAYETATSIDPSFASAHPTLTTKLAQARAKGGMNQGPPSGVQASTNTTASNPGTPGGPGAPQASTIASTLQQNPVYVDPAMQSRVGSVAALNATASDLQHNSSTTVRFAFIHALPTGYATLGAYTYDLFTRLGLKRAVVIVASPHGVSARTDRLSRSETQQLTDQSRAQFLQGSYVQGADTLARAIVKKADDNASASSRTKTIVVLVIVLIVLAALALFIGIRAARWRRAYAGAVSWRDSLTQLLTHTSDEVDALLPDNPAKQTFLNASAYYSTASKILDSLAAVGPLQAAFRLGRHMNALGQVRSNLQAAERSLKEADAQAGGATTVGGAQAVPGGEVTPTAEFRDRADMGPAPAACFFCAKPLNPATAQTVEVPIGNTTRRVMACDEHAADVRAGRQPQIRAVPDPARGGQLAPWWSVPSYYPPRDYVYDPYYYRGGGIGWGDLLLFNALFNQPRNDVVFVDDDGDRAYDQAGYYGYDSDRPDSTSFDAAGRDAPSAAETDFNTGGDYGGDRS